MIESSNIKEWSKIYLHCMRNVEWEDGLTNYRLLEIGVFGIYESTSSSASDNHSLSFYSLPRNSQQLMVATDVKYTSNEDFETL